MGNEYTRQSSSAIVDGSTIQAADLNNEFNKLQDAFSDSAGHTHDGTTAEGGRVTKLGPAGEFTSDATALSPSSTKAKDLGSLTATYRVVYTNGVTSSNGDNLVLTPTGTANVVVDEVTFNGSNLTATNNLSINSLTFPTTDGSSGQVLKTNGSGALEFASLSNSAGTLSGVVDDTSPQLAGNLDVQTHSIVSTSNRNISISPNGTGKVRIGNGAIAYPNTDGSNGQVLTTNGAGVLSFTAPTNGFPTGGSGWTATTDGSNNLIISYGSSTLFKLTTTGALTVEGDITAFGTVA
mgnify:CR=1 FL=1